MPQSFLIQWHAQLRPGGIPLVMQTNHFPVCLTVCRLKTRITETSFAPVHVIRSMQMPRMTEWHWLPFFIGHLPNLKEGTHTNGYRNWHHCISSGCNRYTELGECKGYIAFT